VNESIKLPDAIAAKPLDRDAENYLILNVNADGHVLIGNTAPEVLDNAVKVRSYLQQQIRFDEARATPADWAAKKGRSIVIVRADQRCRFQMVYDVMEA